MYGVRVCVCVCVCRGVGAGHVRAVRGVSMRAVVGMVPVVPVMVIVAIMVSVVVPMTMVWLQERGKMRCLEKWPDTCRLPVDNTGLKKNTRISKI